MTTPTLLLEKKIDLLEIARKKAHDDEDTYPALSKWSPVRKVH